MGEKHDASLAHSTILSKGYQPQLCITSLRQLRIKMHYSRGRRSCPNRVRFTDSLDATRMPFVAYLTLGTLQLLRLASSQSEDQSTSLPIVAAGEL